MPVGRRQFKVDISDDAFDGWAQMTLLYNVERTSVIDVAGRLFKARIAESPDPAATPQPLPTWDVIFTEVRRLKLRDAGL
jgi:hypothetical protein